MKWLFWIYVASALFTSGHWLLLGVWLLGMTVELASL